MFYGDIVACIPVMNTYSVVYNNYIVFACVCSNQYIYSTGSIYKVYVCLLYVNIKRRRRRFAAPRHHNNTVASSSYIVVVVGRSKYAFLLCIHTALHLNRTKNSHKVGARFFFSFGGSSITSTLPCRPNLLGIFLPLDFWL